jgi:hypothetical protein
MPLEGSGEMGSLRDVAGSRQATPGEGAALAPSAPPRAGTAPGLPGARGAAGEKAGAREAPPPTGAARAPANKAPLRNSRTPSSRPAPPPACHTLFPAPRPPPPRPDKAALCPPPFTASRAPGNL